ncbi:hypothetical protein [Seleniivibrio sp.]|uniref:multiheme c-type cytochrome n=1 Tax=Seleniivibrio sp. TaxID=2898801 RepID=UPI0025F4FA08|nr:hypothetical protein [Seleniivibrio sp.]MCD8554468.1 hypothetical protein [Seleniivibrio sp.]
MSRRILFLLMLAFTCAFMLVGCGDDGSDGKNGVDGSDGTDATLPKVSSVEQCSTCHNDIEGTHYTAQGETEGDLQVSGTPTIVNNEGILEIHFKITHLDGKPYTEGFVNATNGYNANLYAAHLTATGWVNYAGGTNGSTTISTTNRTTHVYSAPGAAYIDETDAANGDYVAKYADTTVASVSTALDYADLFANKLNRFVFYSRVYAHDTNGDGVVNTSDQQSTINLVIDTTPDGLGSMSGGTPAFSRDFVGQEACFKCHNDKTGIAHGGRNDVRYCEVCHNTSAFGVSNPKLDLPALVHGIHNSHEMGEDGFEWDTDEFIKIGYPQSMANCVTCHNSTPRYTAVTNTSYFTYDTCMTCHSGWDSFGDAVVPSFHNSMTAANTDPTSCNDSNTCHGGAAPDRTFSDLHGELEKQRSTDVAYSIDSITFNADKSTTVVWGAFHDTDGDGVKDVDETVIDVSKAAATTDGDLLFLQTYKERIVDGLAKSDGVRILVGYYGQGSDDVVVYDEVTSDTIKTAGTDATKSGYTTYAGGVATTKVVPTAANLTNLTKYNVSKGIVGIIGIPWKFNEDDDTYSNVYVKSVTSQFNTDNTAANTAAAARKAVIDYTQGCYDCHGEKVGIAIHGFDEPSAEAHGFDEPSAEARGYTAIGNVDACRICHVPSVAAGHYPQQSRSIDSYLHAIHVGQPTFASYGSHTIEYPQNIANCQKCHVAGAYEVPDQTKSLGGIVAASEGGTTADQAVYGPAAVACGGCHKGAAIAAGNSGEVASLNTHFKTFGYKVLTADMPYIDVLDAVFELLD